MRSDQLGLIYDGFDALPHLTALLGRVREECYQIAAAYGPKTAASEMDEQPSVLNHCLADRDRHELKARHLLWFIKNAPNDNLLTLLCSLRGLIPAEENRMSPEEERDALRAAIKESFTPDIASAVLAKAKRR